MSAIGARKIILIGAGNMAEGMVQGLCNSDLVCKNQIFVYNRSEKPLQHLQQTYDISIIKDIKKATETADIIIVAVNSAAVKTVSEQMKLHMKKDCLLICICAGITLKNLENFLGKDKKIIRVMPNTLINTGQGYSAVCMNEQATPKDQDIVLEILGAIGKTIFLDEKDFDMFTAFSCSGPAYFLYMVSAMIDAGVRAGFPREQARDLTISNMHGVARQLEITGAHPKQIIEHMTSPGGITIEAICKLEEAGVAGALQKSVEAAVRRAKELD